MTSPANPASSVNEKPSLTHIESSDGGKENSDHDLASDDGVPAMPKLSPTEERALYRKIDLRLMPVLSLMYLLSFMDRGNIGNAKLLGLTDQLHLVGNRYNIALTMFFIPYCLFECPANLVLKKFRPSRWLPGIAIVWGIVMTMMGLVKTYPQLVGVRVCLGVTEAGLFPGVVYYLTLWYPRHMLNYRVGLFFGAATVAGAFSGLIAYGISFMGGTDGLLAWSWIFIIEGIATVAVGILSAFVLVDFPSTAKFLTPEERIFVYYKNKYDTSCHGEAEQFEMRFVWAAFIDWKVWAHIIIYMSIVAPLYGISLFLPTIINGFGYGKVETQLLTVPCYVFATTVLLIFAHFSDKLRLRSPFVYGGLLFNLVGFAIQISAAPRGAKYFATFLCVAGSYAAFPPVVAWLCNNLAGQYKRGVGTALHIGIGNFAGAIASNIYRGQDAPRYTLGHGLELMFTGIGFIAVTAVVLIYRRINAQRAAVMAPGNEKGRPVYTPEQLRELGDNAPDFRYTL